MSTPHSLDAPVSVFHGSTNTTPTESVSLAAVLERIQNGTYQQDVKRLRHILSSGDTKAYKAAKEQSMAFTPGCALHTRAQKTPWTEKLISTTQIVSFDFDHLADPDVVKCQLAQNPYIAFAFVSPSAQGLKIGVATSGFTGPDDYRHAWKVILDYLHQTYPDVHLNEDRHVKFLHALCYVSWDPALYLNRNALAFRVPPAAPKRPRQRRVTGHSIDYARVASALAAIPNQDAAYDDWLQLGMALHSTGEAWARDLWEGWSHQSAKFDDAKQEKSWRSFISDGQVTIASLFHQAKQAGWQPSRATRRVNGPRTQARVVPDMTGYGTPLPPDTQQGQHGTTDERDSRPPHNGQETPAAPGLIPLPAGDPAGDLDTVSPCTHVANANRIAREYTDRLRYVLGSGWILWTGHFWRTDPTAEGALATGFVSGLARAIAREAATLLEQGAQERESKDRRDALLKLADARLKWAIQSENERVITAGLKLAKPALLIEYRAVDTDPWLFNCANVTLDLRTGTPHAHNPDDLLTHIAPVTFDPTAHCPTWERFLAEVFAGDTEMVRFIQRAIGWSLSGVVQERALFFLYGPKGHNGKTTLVEAIRDLLGDCGEASFGYARKVDISTFMKSKHQDDNQRKAAMLAGPRFVYSSEVDAEHRLNEQLIKDITGGDTLEGRHLYREAFTFKPTFKPWMYGNHKPEIRGTDDALWSRVKLVPFDVSFENRIDRTLPDKLRAELSGILNWALQGCLDWQREALSPPDKVTIATRQYRLEQDHIAQFIHTGCVVLPQARIKAKRLYTIYLTWCADNGHEARNQHRFGAYLTAHDFPSDENATGHGAIRSGIGLPADSEEDDAPATLSHEGTEKGSRQETQQSGGETDKTASNATLATLETVKSLQKPPCGGLYESKGRKGSNRGSGLEKNGVNAYDAAATLSVAKGSSTRCAQGGRHTYIQQVDGRRCTRCNALEGASVCPP